MNAPRRVISDAEWAPLREAAPGFQPVWSEYRESDLYVAGEAFNSVWVLTSFLEDRLREDDPGPLLAVADAFEAVYAESDDDLEEVLRIGVLEEMIDIAARNGMDPSRLHQRLGPAGRQGWVIAWRYVHPGGPPWSAGDG